MRKTARRATALAAVAALALGAAACGDDEPDDEGGKVDTGSEEPPTLQFTVTEQGKTATLKAPAEAKSGVVKISLKNEGKKVHEAQIVRVTGEQTGAEVLEVIGKEGGPIPDWIEDGGGVGAVEPGRTGEVIQDLEPGRYVAMDTQDKPISAEFTVTDEESGAEFPETEASITAKDYSFETSGLKAGDNVITFENTGKELHHAVIVPVNPGASFGDVRKYLSSDEEPEGKPPVDFESGAFTAVIDGGVKQVTRIPIEAGKYAFVCFIQDRAGGPPHVAKGMITEVDVK
jgi:plastocyanin